MSIYKELTVVVDRDSVCAGDDSEPHRQSFPVAASTTISEFLWMLQEARFLPSIQGGQATWLINCVSEHAQQEKRCIGVAAQQWPIPRLIVHPDTLLMNLLAGPGSLLYFTYRVQSDPVAILASLQSGQALM